MTDPAEVRAEGRRLLVRYETSDPVSNRPTPKAVERWFWEHADVLLADPAPVGLTEDEWELVGRVLANEEDPEYEKSAIIDIFAAEALHNVYDGTTMQEIRHARYVMAKRASDMVSDRFRLAQAIDRLSAAPVDDRERLAELEDWLLGAEHHAGCSGEYKNDDGSWAYRCKCGLRELRDDRLVSPSVDPEEEP